MRVAAVARVAVLAVAVACSGGSGGGAAKPKDRSFVLFQPVIEQLPAAPCPPPAVPEKDRNGSALRCYQLGPPSVTGNDIAAAAAVDGLGGAWEVAFDLTAAGTQAFNAMAAQVGLGNRIAIVLDGAVISAPTLETTQFPGKGRIAGDFTPAQARELAKRLDPG